MPGDMKLLMRAAHFCVREQCSHLEPAKEEKAESATSLYQWTADRPLDKNDQLPSAIDFHCTNVVYSLLPLVEVGEDVLRKMIWIHQSSYNTRVREPVPIPPVWWTKTVKPWLDSHWTKYWKPLTEETPEGPTYQPPPKNNKRPRINTIRVLKRDTLPSP